MNISFTQKSKKERLISLLIGIHALAIVGVLLLMFTGCEKDDEPVKMYSLSVSVAPANAGTVEVSPLSSNGMYKKGTKVTLTVKSAEGHTFNAWSGDAAGSEATIEVLMDENKSINANFDKMYSLNINVTPANAGTVEVTPAPENGVYKEGTKVTLTLKPAEGHQFKGWSGDATGSDATIDVLMDGNKNINANFDIMYSLTLNVTPANAGTVEITPASENGAYIAGTSVLLTVKTAQGHVFKGWSGDATGGAATIEVMMDGNKNINANFDKLYSLRLNVTPADAGTVEVTPASNDGIYTEGSTVTIVATPALTYYLKEWAGDATGSTDILEVAMNSDKTINAAFDFGVKETFNDGVANYFLDDQTGVWGVKDNAYVMTGAGNNGWVSSWYNYDNFDNFEYSVDIKTLDNTNYSGAVGIYFRSQDDDFMLNSYRLAISFDGEWYLTKQINGDYFWINPWTASSDIKTGPNVTNNLKVICSGSSIEVFINGVSQGVFAATEYTSGKVGVTCNDYASDPRTYVYDNFTVKKVTSKQTKSASVSATRLVDTAGMDPRFSK